jgi:predicted Zn-dependent protease
MSISPFSLSRRGFLSGLAASSALSSLTGCAYNPARGESQLSFMSVDEEVRVGREEQPKLIRSFGGELKDAKLQAYVTEIGMSLAKTTESPNLPYNFKIASSDIVNAFALPGGYITMTRGLISLANNEAELAGVIAHELGHVNARHSNERYSKSVLANVGLMALGIATGSQAVAELASVGVGVYLQSYSREQEFEADSLGVRYMTRAGYDPNAMVSFLSNLRRHSMVEAKMAGKPESAVDENHMMATHPRTIDRVQKAMEQAKTTMPANPKIGREVYLKNIDGMIFGDDPEQGIVRGQNFSHPGMRIAFQAPEGFRIHNQPEAVIAVSKQGGMIKFDMRQMKSSSSLRAYIANEWARGAGIRNEENLSVNGMDAAMATVKLSRKSGETVDGRLVAIRSNDGGVYRFLFTSPTNQTRAMESDFIRTLHSFHIMSREEAAKVKPMRLLIVPVKASDNAKALGAHLPYKEFNAEWLMVLNGLEPGAPLPVGKTMKVVAG